MGKFIELTDRDGHKVCYNTDTICWFTSVAISKGTALGIVEPYHADRSDYVQESYETVKEMVDAARAPEKVMSKLDTSETYKEFLDYCSYMRCEQCKYRESTDCEVAFTVDTIKQQAKGEDA